ncbi:MAG TPA: hypothetical protein VM532_11085 [Burkholderiales bacterium]|jgi:hypothetical protein|nr:hypothetical protein [Burkholderiales bacterium]
MKALMIKDLPRTEELDGKAMAAVHGGMAKGSVYSGLSYDQYKPNFSSFDATQLISQTQNVVNENGNNVAFLDKSKIRSNVTSTQDANNTINF